MFFNNRIMANAIFNNKIKVDTFFNNIILKTQFLIIDKQSLIYQKNKLIKIK